MKKQLYLILLIFLGQTLNAQLYVNGEAHYKASVNGRVNFSGSTCGDGITGGLQWITAIYENGSTYTFVKGTSDYPGNGHGLKNQDLNGETNFTENNKIKQVEIRTTRRTTGTLAGCRDTDYRNAMFTVGEMCMNNSYDLDNLGLNQPGYFDFSVKPEVNLNITNTIQDILGYDHHLIVSPISGINSSFFKWQYKPASATAWIDLPANVQQQNFLDIKASDFLPESLIGQNVQLRVDMGCNQATPITFTLRKSAPKVINHGPSVKTTCFDADDGQYRLYFDRPLDSSANEYISIGLVNPATGQPINVDFTNITTLEPDNSYNLTGLPAGDYELKIVGKYNGIDNYSETTANPLLFTIDKNTPVDFSITKTDVWCYQGTDGQIHITASGGTLNGYEYQLNDGNWIPFTNPASFTHTVDGLVEGTYTLKVRDANACIAKIQGVDQDGNIALGIEKELSLTLTAPQQPLTIDYTLIQEPTFNGATNGKLVAKVDGGTIFNDNTYWFEWKNSQGQIIPATTQFTSGSYYITLDQIPSGFYYLTVRDKNHTDATDKANCTIIESEIELTQPEPLTAIIELVQPISCHVDNEFGDETDMDPNDGQRDESQDGILKVIAEGGKQFTGNNNGGRPYKYTWKKQNNDGSWTVLPIIEDTLPQLSDGNYAVNVEDANGIVIGIYQNNILVEPTDVVYYLQQPEKLVLVLESLPATCAGGDGSIKAIVTGGTAPYTYSWTNGGTTAELTNLSAMPYSVNITDARGCSVEGTIVVSEPEHVQITETIIPLLCFNASDAEIDVQVTGGTAPYTYLWNTGATTNKISQLPHGTYTVTITDAQGCSYIRTYTIENPKELVIDLGEDRTLCNGQTLVLDAEIVDEPGTTYNWTSTNGFVSNQSKVELIDPGTYTVTATTPNGCIVTDTVVITRSNLEIDAEFLLTTQAFVNEEVILVNVSNPKGKTTQWFIPDSDAITVNDESDDYITLNFAEKGNYTITLMQTQGDCYELFDKEIIVEENNGQYNPVNANAGFIKEFTVAPNPNNGNFDVIVKLEDAGPVSLRLFNLSGQAVLAERKLPASKVHSVNYNINIPAATYILVLETQYQVLTKKLIIY